MQEKLVRTACPAHCGGNACGIIAHVKNDRVVKLEPADFPDPGIRRICLRGLASTQLLYHPDRLKYPLKRTGERGEGKFERISWDEALDIISTRLQEIATKHGSSAVGWVLGGPGTGTVKFGAYTRFASLFEGTRVSTWGYGDAAGPCGGIAILGSHNPGNYLNSFENPNLNIMWGTNPAESAPFRMRPLLDAKEKGVRLVVIDPLFTVTASKADEYLGVRPGTDGALALGMMNVILKNKLHDEDFIRKYSVGPFLVQSHNGLYLREKDIISGTSDKYMVWDTSTNQTKTSDTPGAAGALEGIYTINGIQCKPAFQLLSELIEQYPPEKASAITGVPTEVIKKLAIAYAIEKPAAIHVDMGLQRTFHGDLTFRAVCTLATLTGNLISPGSYVLNWPAFLQPDRNRNYSRLGVMKMYDAIISGKPFPIKAVWFAFINFINQCANTNRIIKELVPRLEFIVDTDLFMSSTAQYSDIVLPVCTFLEHSDLINGPYPYLQLQQRVIEPLYECKSDVEILNGLAMRMGFERYFDQSEEEFVDLLLASGHPSVEGINVEALRKGPAKVNTAAYPFTSNTRFHTPSGKIEFYTERLRQFGEELPVYKEPLESVKSSLSQKYPLVFIQGHSRFRHHSMYSNVPWLREINPEPVVEMNPVDAQKRGVSDSDMVVVYNDRGRVKLKARLNTGVQSGVVNITQGWWFKHFAEGNFNSLTHNIINPAQDYIYEPNMAMNDNLVEVKRV